MNFLRFKAIASAVSICIFLARLIVALIFWYYGDYFAAAVLIAILAFIIISVSCIYVIGAFNLPKRFYLHIKNRVSSAQKRQGKRLYGINRWIYYIILRYRLYDGAKFKHISWYCFELEIISTAVIFAIMRGWGYGFEFFLLVGFTYFYLNFRYKNKRVHLIPLLFLLLFVFLFLFSHNHASSLTQVIIYLVNGSFAMMIIFLIQMFCEIGKVIKIINDNNRHDYLRSLSSYDLLTETLHKYSFLDIASARLEHSPEEDLISQASVIVIEFTNLSTINQNYSMQIGDVALKEFSYMIKLYSENYDCYISRWSGNEFLIFLINEDGKIANMLAEQISKEAALNRFSIKGIRINSEAGIASTSKFDYELGDLIDQALLDLKINKEKSESQGEL